MTLSVKWKEEHFLQRHHTTFVDKKMTFENNRVP